MSNVFDVVTLGEAMLMLVANEPGPIENVSSFSKRTAGAETNVAIGLSRLGLKVSWSSSLGNDSMGRYLLKEMMAEGIDCSQVKINNNASTGFQFKGNVTDGSDPPVEYFRKGSAASLMTCKDLDLNWLLSSRHLHVTGVFAAISGSCQEIVKTAITEMKKAGKTVSFDPNIRPSLWNSTQEMREALNALAIMCDWVLPGVEEGFILMGSKDPEQIAQYYREQGVSRVVVKLGSQGAYFDDCDYGKGYIQAYPVDKVVDTVGAGDGFAVGVISALLSDKSIVNAAKRGAWIGAKAVQVRGDTEGLPTYHELKNAGV